MGDEGAVVGDDIDCAVDWRFVVGVLLEDGVEQFVLILLGTQVNHNGLAGFLDCQSNALHPLQLLLHDVDLRFQLIQLPLIFAILHLLQLGLQLVLLFLVGPDEIGEHNEGYYLELGKHVPQWLSRGCPRQTRLHELPGDPPMLFGEEERHESQDSRCSVCPIGVIASLGVVALVQFSLFPEVVDFPHFEGDIRDHPLVML